MKKFIIPAILLIVSLPIFYFLWLFITFSGGVTSIIANLKPDINPNSEQISLKRQSIIDEINISFNDIDSEINFNKYDITFRDGCLRGESNYKRSDGYSNLCTYTISKFYRFNGDFRQNMINLEEELYKIGWKSSYEPEYPTKQMLEEYYDKYYGTGTKYYPKGYYVSNLPTSYSYEKDGQTLKFNFAESATDDLSDFGDSVAVIERITKENNFVISLSITKTYFRN